MLDELEHAGVKLLVDVRAVAASRRPGFSKNQLAAGLKERGIGYLHLQGLGTPKEGRLAARAGDKKALRAIYAKHLKTPQAKQEMDELADADRQGRPGLHPLLRARPPGMPPQIHRRDHRGKDGVAIENLVGAADVIPPAARASPQSYRLVMTGLDPVIPPTTGSRHS